MNATWKREFEKEEEGEKWKRERRREKNRKKRSVCKLAVLTGVAVVVPLCRNGTRPLPPYCFPGTFPGSSLQSRCNLQRSCSHIHICWHWQRRHQKTLMSTLLLGRSAANLRAKFYSFAPYEISSKLRKWGWRETPNYRGNSKSQESCRAAIMHCGGTERNRSAGVFSTLTTPFRYLSLIHRTITLALHLYRSRWLVYSHLSLSLTCVHAFSLFFNADNRKRFFITYRRS